MALSFFKREDRIDPSEMGVFYSNLAVGSQLADLARPGEMVVRPTHHCEHCGSPISDHMLRGKAVRTKSSLIAVSAKGFCLNCHTMNTVRWVIHTNGMIETRNSGLSEIGGRESSIPGLVAAGA